MEGKTAYLSVEFRTMGTARGKKPQTKKGLENENPKNIQTEGEQGGFGRGRTGHN